MKPGFQSLYVAAMCDQDGRNWKLIAPVDYLSGDGRHFRIPRGASTDGASTPAIIWAKLPPTGDYWLPAVLHDAAYQNTLHIVTSDGTEAKAELAKADCDNLLKEAMSLCGVSEIVADVIYEGVNMFGAASFRDDRGLKS